MSRSRPMLMVAALAAAIAMTPAEPIHSVAPEPEPEPPRPVPPKPGRSKYMPHQGNRERARRLRQLASLSPPQGEGSQ